MHILVLSIYANIVLAHIPEKRLVFFHELPLLYTDHVKQQPLLQIKAEAQRTTVNQVPLRTGWLILIQIKLEGHFKKECHYFVWNWARPPDFTVSERISVF